MVNPFIAHPPGSQDVDTARQFQELQTFANEIATDFLRWGGSYDGGCYPAGTIVLDDGWLMVANKDTCDKPAPFPTGDPFYLYTGASPTSTITAKSLTVGNEYTWGTSGYLTAYRVYTITGNVYTIWTRNAEGVTNQVATFTASATGWQEFPLPETPVVAGSTMALALTVQEPDPSPNTFTLSYNYTTPNNPGTPGAGVILHANQASSELRVNKTDQNGDQSAQLATMDVGDTIEGAGVRWAIQGITDNGTWINFAVAPASQGSPDGVGDFIFETTNPTPITTVIDPGFYAADARVQPFYEVDGSGQVLSDDGYGIDIQVQAASISPDWDVMVPPSQGIGGTVPDVDGFFPILDPASDFATWNWETVEALGQISYNSNVPYIRFIRESIAEGTYGRRWSLGSNGDLQAIVSTQEFSGSEITRLKIKGSVGASDPHQLVGSLAITAGNAAASAHYNLGDSPPALALISGGAGRSWNANSQTELLIERGGNCYMTLCAPAENDSYINFANPGNEFDGGIIRYDNANDNMYFYQGGTVNLSIAPNGYTLFNINGATNGVVIESGGTSSSFYGIQVADSAGSRQFRVRSDGLIRMDETYGKTTGGGANMHITSAGWLYRSTSSAQYKENIRPLLHKPDVIMALRPVTFKSKLRGAEEFTDEPGEDAAPQATGRFDFDGQGTFTGFIAEEVQAAIPEMESEPDNYDVRAIVAHLVAEVQALRREIETLKGAS